MDTVETKRKPILGILSLILFGISLLPALGIVSVFGIILGVIAIFREPKLLAILGTIFSCISLAISPAAWLILASLWFSVACKIMDCPNMIADSVQQSLEKPENKKAIGEFIAKGIEQQQNNSADANKKPMASLLVSNKQGFQTIEYKDTPNAMSNSAHNNVEKDIGSFKFKAFDRYQTSPNYQSVYLNGFIEKPQDQPLDSFIQAYTTSYITPTHPNVVITPMKPITIKNSCSETLKTAELRLFSGFADGHEEVVAYIDGGFYVAMLIVSAPNREELMKANADFTDTIINGMCFGIN